MILDRVTFKQDKTHCRANNACSMDVDVDLEQNQPSGTDFIEMHIRESESSAVSDVYGLQAILLVCIAT